MKLFRKKEDNGFGEILMDHPDDLERFLFDREKRANWDWAVYGDDK